MAISHSCHTDICRTVRRFSRLLLQSSVMSERNSFFTSSSCSVCFDCRINVATTFRITGSTTDVRPCRKVNRGKQTSRLFIYLANRLTWIFQTIVGLGFGMSGVQYLLTNVLCHNLKSIYIYICIGGERLGRVDMREDGERK